MDSRDIAKLTSAAQGLINKIGDSLEPIAKQWGALEALKLPEGQMKTIARMEFVELFLYLSASDGVIDDAEVEVLNKVFETALTAQDCKDIIIEHDIYSNRFQNKLPLLFTVALYVDERMKARGADLTNSLVETLLSSYQTVGMIVTSIDGDIASQEKADLYGYLNSIRNQVEENRPLFRKRARLQ